MSKTSKEKIKKFFGYSDEALDLFNLFNSVDEGSSDDNQFNDFVDDAYISMTISKLKADLQEGDDEAKQIAINTFIDTLNEYVPSITDIDKKDKVEKWIKKLMDLGSPE